MNVDAAKTIPCHASLNSAIAANALSSMRSVQVRRTTFAIGSRLIRPELVMDHPFPPLRLRGDDAGRFEVLRLFAYPRRRFRRWRGLTGVVIWMSVRYHQPTPNSPPASCGWRVR